MTTFAQARVVGRPAQQQVVIRDDEVGARQCGAPATEGTLALARALVPREHCSDRTATERRSMSRSMGWRKKKAPGRVPTSPWGRVLAHASSTAHARRSSASSPASAPAASTSRSRRSHR